MDRDEFMELVYETFADEPDNVLANGIIEAADAYAEHEKAQLFSEDTTSDTISRTEVVEHLRRMLEATVPNTDYDEGYIDGIEFGISTVSTMPSAQPEPQWILCDERMPEDLEEVNVTWVNRNPESYYESIKDKPFTATAVYYKGKWYWWSTYTQDLLAEYGERCNVGLLHEAIEVTAWMPLPEPYQKGATT